MTKPLLGIIIPAYKSKFLERTLNSLASQTNEIFHVYVGNDGGDPGIEAIVEKFKNQLEISYHYFPKNLGKVSLTKQWSRCMELLGDEEWVWILPDDDYADPDCVKKFYEKVYNNDFDLFRFNINFVTENETIFKTNPKLPGLQSSFDSLIEKLSFVRPSSIAEYIFRKNTMLKYGFEDIPMAWGSDDLLWYQLGNDKGIVGCNDQMVYLRQSSLNLSNNYTELGTKKIESNFIFFKKLLMLPSFQKHLKSESQKKVFQNTALQFVMYNLQDFKMILPFSRMLKYSYEGNRIWGGGLLKNMRRFYLNNGRIKKANG